MNPLRIVKMSVLVECGNNLHTIFFAIAFLLIAACLSRKSPDPAAIPRYTEPKWGLYPAEWDRGEINGHVDATSLCQIYCRSVLVTGKHPLSVATRPKSREKEREREREREKSRIVIY